MRIAPGTRLGPYEVVSLLGHGGMGEVWSARDTRLDRVVAVKVLPPELASDLGRGRKLSSVSVTVGASPHISPPAQLFTLPPGNDFYTAAGDGKRFLILVEAGSSPTPVIQVVVNWMTALRSLVPYFPRDLIIRS